MRLEPLDRVSAPAWNELIVPYDTAMFYHDAAWLEFLEQSGRGEVVRFKIREEDSLMGYFVGTLVRKGPFRVLGSPLSGSMSEYMGPVVDRGLDIDRFLIALDRLCRDLRIHQLETGSPLFEPELMRRHGYAISEWMTFRIPLTRDEEAMWASLKSKCRNRVRKGIENRLVVEDSDDPAFIDTHYRQLGEVYRRQRLVPPFTIYDLRTLFRHLKPQGLLFSLEVKQEGTDEVVATGIFPHDGRRVYSLSTASGIDARKLCPNELLHWSVMRLAGQRGMQVYSIGDNYRVPGSGGKFKDKFNGSYEPVYRYIKNYSVLAKYSRQLYVALRRVKGRVAGRLS